MCLRSSSALSPLLESVQLWHVYVLAFLSGSALALDAPVRQTFVAEMVGDEDLPNAVALNSMSFNSAQMIGPAVAGLLIASVGIGWAFLLNGLSFAAVLISMSFFRHSELRANPQSPSRFRWIYRRPSLCVEEAGPRSDPGHVVSDRNIRLRTFQFLFQRWP